MYFIVLTKVGHVDFYPNAGIAPQPGCFGEPLGLDCSHQRANVSPFFSNKLYFINAIFLISKNNMYENIVTKVYKLFLFVQKLFEESINSDVGFRSVLCDSWQDFKVTFVPDNKENF